MRSRPTAYSYPEIQKTVERLAALDITDAHIEFLARRVHKATGWAGTPIPWDKWTEAGRQEGLAHARAVLEEAKRNTGAAS